MVVGPHTQGRGSEGAPSVDDHEGGHVALVGFMGSGKTSIGRCLADRTGLWFVDLDEVIEEQAGIPISKIFREQGEVGFRALERAALRQLLAENKPMIIATGGGTFVDLSMREWLQASATTVYLKATPQALAARVAQGEARNKRPLLAGPDPVATIHRLLSERAPAYEQCAHIVCSDHGSPAEIADAVVRALKWESRGTARRRRARRQASAEAGLLEKPALGTPFVDVVSRFGRYGVELRPEAGPWLAEAVAKVTARGKLALISDTTVSGLHAEALLGDLRAAGKSVVLHTVNPGEGSKSSAVALQLYDALMDQELGRSDAVVALGGGVVGDLAGFLASTYMRGTGFVQVPTTTLAAVDASVGGKTAINSPRGKNLIGTFYPPKAVLISAAHLQTQERRVHAAGLVEAVKIAATMDVSFFEELALHVDALLAFEAEALLPAIAKAVALKAEVVSRDEQEQGERAVLNYGHTVGHAIEAGSGFTMPHGEAVALGMLAEAAWAEAEGLTSGVTERLFAIFNALGFADTGTRPPVDMQALRLDKKRLDRGVRMPVVRTLGSYEFHEVPLSALESFLRTRRNG